MNDNRPLEVSIGRKDEALEALLPVSHYTDAEFFINLDNLPQGCTVEDYLKNDKFPLPKTSDREGYHGERHYDFWRSGLKDYLYIKQALNRFGMQLDESTAVLEFGCASGRVLRHFLCQEPYLKDIWGTDINIRHIDWILRFLGPSLKVFQNTVLPNLPLEDNSLSLVCCFSVFTHIDEFELAWLAELRRILKPGGMAYITFHSDYTWNLLEPKYPLYQNLLKMREKFPQVPDISIKPMPAERVVFKWQYQQVNNSQVFHSTQYIRHTWGRFFHILDIIQEGSVYQDVIILRK